MCAPDTSSFLGGPICRPNVSSSPSPDTYRHPCLRLLSPPLVFSLGPAFQDILGRSQVPCVPFAVQFAICQSARKVYSFASLQCDHEKRLMRWRCRCIRQNSKWLVHDSLEHEPRGQKGINQQLTPPSVSHVDVSTQSKDTSICHYRRKRTTTSGRIQCQPNTASSGVRSSHRIPWTQSRQPILPRHIQALLP